jgi:hypothetical protein
VSAQTAIPVPMDVPVAGWVNEGGVKPVAQVGVGVKTMVGKKCAVLVPVSQEVAMTNPGGLYDQLAQDLPTAIARAFDQAAINGKDLRSGGAGPFNDYLTQSANTVALGTAANTAGGIYADLVNGIGKVVDKNYDFTGFAATRVCGRRDAVDRLDGPADLPVAGRPRVRRLRRCLGTGALVGYPSYFNRACPGSTGVQGRQRPDVTINGTPTGGTFVLSSGGNSTSLAYNAAASTVQTAVQAGAASTRPSPCPVRRVARTRSRSRPRATSPRLRRRSR